MSETSSATFGGTAASMRIAEHRVRTPGASIWTAASGDQVDAARTVILTPHAQILFVIDAAAVGPRQGVEVIVHDARRAAHRCTGRILEGDAAYPVEHRRVTLCECRQQLRHRDLAFAHDDDVGARCQIFVDVVGALRPSQDDGPLRFLGRSNDRQHRTPGHQVRVDAEYASRRGGETRAELFAATEGAVVDVDPVAGRLEIGGQVKQAERRIRLHDLPLLLVLSKEVAVREQQVAHVDCSFGVGQVMDTSRELLRY